MKLVAIDPGLTLGAAFYDDGDMDFKLLDLHAARKRSIGDALVCLEEYMRPWLKGRDALVIEEPCPKNMVSAKVQYAMYGICLKCAAEYDLQYVLYNNQSIKKFADAYIKANTKARELAELMSMFESAPDNKVKSLIYFYLISGERMIDHNIADAAVLLGLALKELANDSGPHAIQWKAEACQYLQSMGR